MSDPRNLTVDELITRLQALKVAHPDIGRSPALLVEPAYVNGEYDHDDHRFVVDARAMDGGVVLSATYLRRSMTERDVLLRKDADRETECGASLHRCGCGGQLATLAVRKCVDGQRLAHQCVECKTNDGDGKFGPYVYDMLSWCQCAVCSRLTQAVGDLGTLDRAVLERAIIRLVLGDAPPVEGP